MYNNNLNLSIIHCEKLRSIVGQGSRSPYQVWITPGNLLGLSGTVMNPSTIIASNDAEMFPNRNVPASWLTRALTALKL